jgi:hypothetical protein
MPEVFAIVFYWIFPCFVSVIEQRCRKNEVIFAQIEKNN